VKGYNLWRLELGEANRVFITFDETQIAMISKDPEKARRKFTLRS